MTAFMCINEPIEDKKEIGRWLAYHRCEPMMYPGKDGVPVLAVKVPIVCTHLERKDGVFGCRIYENRPVVCKEYLCPRVRNGVRIQD